MRREQFDKHMIKLGEVFGASRYPQAKTDILFQEVCRQPEWLFSQSVIKLIKSSRYAPTIDEIVLSMSQESYGRKEPKEIKSFVSCRYCSDTGFILWSKKGSSEKTCATQCHRCSEGHENASGLKKASEGMQEHWEFHFSVKNRFRSLEN